MKAPVRKTDRKIAHRLTFVQKIQLTNYIQKDLERYKQEGTGSKILAAEASKALGFHIVARDISTIKEACGWEWIVVRPRGNAAMVKGKADLKKKLQDTQAQLALLRDAVRYLYGILGEKLPSFMVPVPADSTAVLSSVAK